MTFDATAAGSIISTPFNLILGGATLQVADGAADADLLISGIISNSRSITKTGLGTLVLTGANTYSAGTAIIAGTLVLGHATSTLADTGGVTVSGGTLDIGSNSDTVGAVTLSSGSITGTSGVLTGSSYDVRSGTVSAILGGSAALTKTTDGTVTLSGNNTYTGTTTVSGGTLVVNGALLGELGDFGERFGYTEERRHDQWRRELVCGHDHRQRGRI